MNTTYTYIQTHKSLYENQVLSCGSSSRGADKPNTKYVAGRKGNRSNQPTCALLSRNCFKLVISHCLTAAPQLFRYCWWKGWGMSDLRNQNCLFTKQVQDGQKQSKIFPSASVLLSIKAGWPCPGKISRRFILSSQCSWLMYRANDDLGATPQEKIKFVVIFHLLQMPATRPASWRWQLSVITDWRGGVGRSDQEAKTSVSLISYPAFPSHSRF